MKNETKIDYSVSVVIPAYNSGNFIARAIDSVLAQIHQPDEIIVVDDGSTDDTAEIVKRFGERVRYIHQENAGAGAARNNGVRQAGSNWIAFLDSDDEWLPEYLQTQLAALKDNKDIDWCCANFTKCLCDENKQATVADTDKALSVYGSTVIVDNYFKLNRLGFIPTTSTFVIKKSIIEEAGYFDTCLYVAQDYDLWWRIAYRHTLVLYDANPQVVLHIGRSDSLTSMHKASRSMLMIGLYNNHLKLASEYGVMEEFVPYIKKQIRLFIRSRLFHNQPDVIKLALNDFSHLLSPAYKLFIRTLMLYPKITANTCFMISKIVRKFNLRKGVYRKP